MKTRAELLRWSKEADFRPEALEKVYLLQAILHRLEDNELSQGQWVLKGGTAINLFHWAVPRLSVDIDINFIGVEDVERLVSSRDVFERTLTVSCAREGCSVKRAPDEHAGGKFRLRYPSLLGGQQKLEIDVSYVARVPLLGIEKKTCLLHEITRDDPLPLLTLAELTAGKFTALITRGATRDFFDALSIINHQPTTLKDVKFRVALLCQVAGSRTDLRNVEAIRTLSKHEVESQLLPLLRVHSSTAPFGTAELLEKLNEVVRPTVQEIVQWSDAERHFLERFLAFGELEPQHLTDDGELQTRISRQPMLLWKQMHVRKHLGLDS